MRNPLYNDDFEHYLQQQVNQHRMYPSDNVWRSIQNHLHGYKRWPALTFITIFVISALVVGTVLTKPPAKTYLPSVIATATNVSANKLDNPDKTSAETLEENLSVEQITRQTIATVIEKINTDPFPENDLGSITQLNSALSHEAVLSNALDIRQKDYNTINMVASAQVNKEATNLFSSSSASPEVEVHGVIFNPPPFSNLISASLRNMGQQKFTVSGLNMPDHDFANLVVTSTAPQKTERGLSDFDFEFYLTPSISYRKLSDDMHGQMSKSYISAIPLDANYTIDANQVIRHRPAIGYEVGAAMGYRISDKFSLRSGFQFNVRQYNIDAYAYTSEPASITLFNNNTAVTLNTLSAFRSIPGRNPITLKNRYYELSIPVGVDWRPIMKGRISWGVAASIQPTYSFDKEPFIITSNLKNYADGSQIMRNWNINTNFETYFGYNIGTYRWQIGPQVRYQILPTMSSKYPIRERLIDYGLKVGFVKTLK